MIFGVLNLEKIWHQQLVHLPTSPVYRSHFTLGNQKSHFRQYYSYTLQLTYVISEENKLLLHPRHLKNVTALPCKMHNFFVFFMFYAYRVLIRDTDELGKRLVATWAEFQQSVVDDAVDQWRKDWKRVSVQKLSLIHISEPTRPY